MIDEIRSAATGIIRLAAGGDAEAMERQVDWVTERHGAKGAKALSMILAHMSAAAAGQAASLGGQTLPEFLATIEAIPDLGDDEDDD